MKLVIHTQFRENYGAHDWDGKGACPQYWKNKGGDTYFIDVNLQEAQDPEFYAVVEKCIEHSSDYSEEYIISQTLVDDIDFDESNYVEDWERPITAFKPQYDNYLWCIQAVKSYDLSNTVVGERTWLQDKNGMRDVKLKMFEQEAA